MNRSQEQCRFSMDEGRHGLVEFTLRCTVPPSKIPRSRGFISLVPVQVGDEEVFAVEGIHIDEDERRRGYGTRLYEKAAAFACRKHKRLASIARLPEAHSNDFWSKQERKGRALRVPKTASQIAQWGGDDIFVLNRSCGEDLSAFQPPRRWPLYAAGAAGLVALVLLAKGKTEPPLQVKAERKKYGPLLDVAAERYGIPTSLLRAVAWVESRWSPTDVSPKGAVGLLQLMPGTATALGVTNRTNPVQNANGGAKFLADLYKKAGSWEVALAAYNWGPGNVFGSSTRMPSLYPSQWPANTQQYVREIMDAQQRGVE